MRNFEQFLWMVLPLLAPQGVSAKNENWISPVYTDFFQFPMPIPPVKVPLFTFTSPETGAPVDYFEIEMKPHFRQQYPNLPPTRMLGYDGITPGPTFNMTQGRESVVRQINHADRATSVHLHGSFSRSPFDGWADDITLVGQYKDYYYPNRQNARTLWYHDHAVDNTAENVFYGLAGFYILHDSMELSSGLPTGEFDVPFGIFTRQYVDNGSLWDPEGHNETTSLYGDVVEVNGQPWPFFAVEPRKYRFRLLDMGISRTYMLYLTADQQNAKIIPFTIVGADTGLLAKPVVSENITMSIAERWEIVIDFTGFAGQNITMMNMRQIAADIDFPATDRIARFVVGNVVTSNVNNGPIPDPLRAVPFAPANETVAVRHFLFERQHGQWLINGFGWHDLAERVMANPQRGAVEMWMLQNGGGGWSHPIHIHLIDFQVIKRVGSDRPVLPYEAVAQQDVVWLGPSETVTVLARYAPWPGLYMFHCHNLIHEDHMMLAAFNVTNIPIPGLNETNLFIDPTDPTYSAKDFPPQDFIDRTGDFSEEAIHAKVNFFTSLNAYADVDEVEAILEAFWAAKTAAEKRDTSLMVDGVPAEVRRRAFSGLTTRAEWESGALKL